MKGYIKWLLVFKFIAITHSTNAQNTWVDAMPLSYHPSFAGSTGKTRIASLNYINKFVNTDYNSSKGLGTNLSVDGFIPKIHLGVGVQIGYAYSKEDGKMITSQPYTNNFIYNRFGGSFVLAPKFSFKGKYTLSPSILLGIYNSNRQDLSIIFNDSIGNSHKLTSNVIFRNKIFNTGLLFNSKKYYLGVNFLLDWLHIKSDGTYYYYFNNNRFLSASIITGYTFRKNETSNLSVTPVLYLMQNIYPIQDFTYLPLAGSFISVSVKYKKFLSGIDSHRNIMLGYESKKFKIMLIQSFRSSADYQSYAAQVSLKYLIYRNESDNI